MSTAPPLELSLLVKAQLGKATPYALEDLRTGWRREVDGVAELLQALDLVLRSPTTPPTGSQACN